MSKLLFLFVALVIAASSLEAQPLTPCASNPRYFCKADVPVLLTGSHTWWNMYDRGEPYNFTAYLDFLQAKNHNFIRLWAWEEVRGNCCSESSTQALGPEFPWLRTGPGVGMDGLPKFDLTRPNPAFLSRLRDRIIEAGARNIYVSIMLFEGWELRNDPEFWPYHPFHPDNNVNGVDGQGLTYHTLTNPAVTALQIAYVRSVIKAVNDLDNVLYEISNESAATVPDNYWQNALISEIKTYEGTLPKQHPVGMSWQYAAERSHGNAPLWASLADWIAPGCTRCFGGADVDDYGGNPPVSTGDKVVFADTDHVYGEGGDAVWVWKNFLRGGNPIFMDRFPVLNDWRESARNAMGHVRAYRADLNNQIPQNNLSSSGYCLCSASRYATLVFVSGKGKRSQASVTVQMQPGLYTVTWFNVFTGESTSGGTVNHSGGSRLFTPPIKTTIVLLLSK